VNAAAGRAARLAGAVAAIARDCPATTLSSLAAAVTTNVVAGWCSEIGCSPSAARLAVAAASAAAKRTVVAHRDSKIVSMFIIYA